MSQSRRRKWTPQRKVQIVLETLGSDSRLAEICWRGGLSPNLVYQWRKQLLASAEAVFARKFPVGRTLASPSWRLRPSG